ncbi:MAG TPA: SDR family oxidoreductase [Gemmatimonadaceae bacterium]|nr:SDR family oxidoreductase [Gemmatimonadaceae bacterium]
MEDALSRARGSRGCGAFDRVSVLPRTFIMTRPCGYSLHCESVISTAYRQVRDDLRANPRVWVITGIAGFIGSNLLQELLALGQKVVGIDNFSTGHRANLDEVLAEPLPASASFRMIEGDIRDLETCRSACEGADYVLHHAALGSVPWSMDDPLRTNSVNVDGFINMLVAAKDVGVRRFVYASSSAVYGDTMQHPQVETILGRPLSPYAASKSTNEIYAAAFQMGYGLETVGLRYFNVFGRRQDPSGAYAAVIPRWIASLLRGERCRIFGDGETTRDFCFIANVVQANVLAATVNDTTATCQPYNIACGESVSLNQLFFSMRDGLAKYDRTVTFAAPQYDDFRAGDIRFSCAAIDKARDQLAYSPTHSVAEGLNQALEWYVAQHRATVERSGMTRRHSPLAAGSVHSASLPLVQARP